MDEATLIINAVGSLGFPIVMCLVITWLLNQETKSHKEELSHTISTIERNTEALVELKEICRSLKEK